MSTLVGEFAIPGWDQPLSGLWLRKGDKQYPARNCGDCGGVIPAHWHDCGRDPSVIERARKWAKGE